MVSLNVNSDVQGYIDGVEDGSIVTCKWVKLAISRHLSDLKSGKDRGIYFDPDDAQIVLDFFPLLQHSQGKWAGKPFELEPWQKFILWVVFGWKKADGTRRFTICYNEMGRKNGKSTFAAAIGLVLLLLDGEPGAEVYTVATKLDQAKIIHTEAQRMVKASAALKKKARVYRSTIVVESTNSKYVPLGRDSDTQDGLNVSGALVDELHAHKTREMWDVIDSAIGAREQALLFAITTAGFNQNGICFEQRDYAIKVLTGSIIDDSFFAIIYTLDRDEATGEMLDDWKDEKCWIKANPNLGVSVRISDMRRMCKAAIESPSKQNNFFCKKLSIWTSQENRWLNMEHWNLGQDEIDPVAWRKDAMKRLIGRECIGALDLSSTTDISCHLLLFADDGEDESEKYTVLPFFWIPKDNAHARERRDRVPYSLWARQGFVTMTDGNSIDYKFIRQEINDLQERYKHQEIAYDPYNATHLATELGEDDGFNMVEFRQGFISMNEPTKECERLVLSHAIEHGNNPVLKWMASNVSVKTDPSGNIKPVKPDNKSALKIDGMVCLIMAIGRAMFGGGADESIYETRGMVTV